MSRWSEDLTARKACPIRTCLLLCLALSGAALSDLQAATVYRAGSSPGPLASGDAYVSAAIGEQGILALRSGGKVELLEQKEGSTHFIVPQNLTNAVAIAALGNAAGALRSDGKVVTWGTYPRPAPSGLSNVVALAVGGDVNLALRSDGTVATWSDPALTGPLTIPPDLTDVIAISTTWTYVNSVALRANGSVAAWGSHSIAADHVPEEATNIVAIAAGLQENFALRADGTVLGWGGGEAGYPPGGSDVSYPFTNTTGIVDIAAGPGQILALTGDGRLVGYGDTDLGFTNVVAVSPVDARGFMVVTGDGSPVLVNEPPDTAGYLGEKIRLIAKIGGRRPMTVQWSKDGVPVPGATNAILLLDAAQASDTGAYQLFASNAQGHAVSRVAQVRILQGAPVIRRIVLEPATHTPYLGGKAVLHAELNGAAPLGFQWQLDGVAIAGATNSTLSFESLRLEDRGRYTVVVSNSTGTATSAPFSLNVSPLVIWGNPIIRNHGIPSAATNLVAVTSSGTDITALRADGSVLVWGLAEDYAQLNAPPGLSNVVAVASGGGVIAALKADGQITGWGWNYAAMNVPPGLSNIISIALAGNSLFALRNDGAVLVFGDNEPARRLTRGLHDAVALSTWGGLALRSDGTVVSFSSDVLLPPPSSDLTNALAIALGRSNAQAILADGSITQWGTIYDSSLLPQPTALHDFIAVSNGGDHVLALRANGEVVGWGSDGQRQASVPPDLHGVAAISAGYSHSMALVDDGPPRLFQQPLDVGALIGGNARLAANAFGAPPLRYQWRVDGLTLIGATNAVLALDDLSYFDDGTYDVVVSNDHGSVTSRTARITVQLSAPFDVTVQVEPATGAALIGSSALLSAFAEGTAPFAYRWFHNGAPILESREPILRLNQVQFTDAGEYTVVAANAFGSSTSAPVRLTPIQVAVWGDNFDRQLETPPSATNLAAVSAGMYHTVGLRADGTVMVWGNTPIDGGMHPGGTLQPPADLSNVVAVAAGGGFNVALKADGRVVGWGDNSWGQISGLSQWSNIVAVAADYNHTLGLRADGTVLARGANFAQQSAVPPDLNDGIAIAAGWEASTVLRSDGSVVQWGTGQKVPDGGRHDIVAIAPGIDLRKDGTVSAWPDPTAEGLAPIVAISGSRDRQLILRADGTVWPDAPLTLTNVISIAAGFQHSVALMGGGAPLILQHPLSFTTVSGRNARFAVGASGAQPIAYQWRHNGRPIPYATNQVLALDRMALFDDGEYDAIASNSFGSSTSRVAVLTLAFEPPSALALRIEPANGIAYTGGSARLTATASGSSPLQFQWVFQGHSILDERGSVLQLTHVTPADAGEYLAMAANAFGSATSAPVRLSVVNVAGWGSDARGTGLLSVPASASNAVALSAGLGHAMALRSDGSVLAWGNPFGGRLNIPPTVSNLTSIVAGGAFSLGLNKDGSVLVWVHTAQDENGLNQVPNGLTNVVQLAAGSTWALALRADGTVSQWGTSPSLPPAGLFNVVQIAARGGQALALLRDGKVVGWGTLATDPTAPVTGLSNVVAVAAGGSFNLALLDDGTVFEWGRDALIPPSEATNLIAIAAGQSHRLGLRDDGTVVTWGINLTDVFRVPAGLPPAIGLAAGETASFALLPASGEPHFGRQPRRQTLYTGQRLRLEASVLAGAAPVAFQWFRNGRELPAQTNAVLEVLSASASDAGTYSVTVKNVFGGASSRDALVSVIDQAPFLVDELNDLDAYEGGSATLSAIASGSEPLTYQWFFKNEPVAGATNASFTLSPVTLAHAGPYQVRVSNAFGDATSRSASLTVPRAVYLSRNEFGVKPDGTFRMGVRISSALSEEVRVRWQYATLRERFSDFHYLREGFMTIPAGSLEQCAEIQDPAVLQFIGSDRAVVVSLLSADLAMIAEPRDVILRAYAGASDDLVCETTGAAPARFEPGEMQRRPDGVLEILFSAGSGARITVEASADLVSWSEFEGIIVRDPASERVWFIDPETREHPARFYRIRSE